MRKGVKREGFVAVLKTLAGVGHLKKICKDAVAWQALYKRLVPEIYWEELHFRALDLQVCWDDFAWQVQHFVWPGFTLSSQAQHFTQMEWKNRKTHWYEAVSSALNFLFLKEVSQNCFVFDVVKFKNWGSLAELLRFWRCQVKTLRKSRWIAAFSMLSTLNIEEMSLRIASFSSAQVNK